MAEYSADFDQSIIDLFRFVQPFTMTTKYAVFALRDAVRYIVKSEIPGDIVECGVWKGGSMMAVARELSQIGRIERELYLFDTFEGMPPPGAIDVQVSGEAATDLLASAQKQTDAIWAFSPLDEVKRNLALTGYPTERIHFIPGKVEETLPDRAPQKISLLRLDTDWFESTYHELVHLYSRLSVGGVMIIDDYGHWQGARKAVDQFIQERKLKLLLQRIDHTARICVKIEP